MILQHKHERRESGVSARGDTGYRVFRRPVDLLYADSKTSSGRFYLVISVTDNLYQTDLDHCYIYLLLAERHRCKTRSFFENG